MDIAEEPRSFAPVLAASMRTEPVDENRPTLKGLARAHNQLHDCLDDTRAKVENIEQALGIGEGQRKVSGLLTQLQAYRNNVLAVASTFIALALLYKLCVLIAPGLMVIWKALAHAALKGVF
jgi:hypothetical protein